MKIFLIILSLLSSQLQAQFKRGEISRNQYESEVLYLQALAALAELEVYEYLVNYPQSFGKYDVFNNKQMLEKYRKITKGIF